MAETTIEWTSRRRPDGSLVPGYTFNHVRGCTKVSEGCKNCYADTFSKRNPKSLGVWGPLGTRVIAAEAYWDLPLKWNEEAKQAGERRFVFCASLADVFEGPETCQNPETYATLQAARRRLFMLAHRCNWLDWLFLTKRPENIKPILQETLHADYPHTSWWDLQCRQPRPQWWFGTSVENQEAADKRIPALLDVPAAVRFLSCEPLLGPVDLSPWIPSGAYSAPKPEGYDKWPKDRQEARLTNIAQQVYMARCAIGIHWVIAGGESGGNARPAHPNWFRSLREQCVATGISFLFKQHGEFLHDSQTEENLWARFVKDGNVPDNVVQHTEFGGYSYRVGKKAAGRLLDDRTWDEFPADISNG